MSARACQALLDFSTRVIRGLYFPLHSSSSTNETSGLPLLLLPDSFMVWAQFVPGAASLKHICLCGCKLVAGGDAAAGDVSVEPSCGWVDEL